MGSGMAFAAVIAKSISLCRTLTSTYWNQSQLVKKNSIFHEGFDSIGGFLSASKSYDLLTSARIFACRHIRLSNVAARIALFTNKVFTAMHIRRQCATWRELARLTCIHKLWRVV